MGKTLDFQTFLSGHRKQYLNCILSSKRRDRPSVREKSEKDSFSWAKWPSQIGENDGARLGTGIRQLQLAQLAARLF
jgi:hypothetical protein